MSDINLVIQSALFKELKNAGIVLDGGSVPVYSYAPTNALAPFIRIDQVSTVPLNGSAACRVWESVFQITVLTSFNNVGDDLPSLIIEGQIVDVLDNKQLMLTDNYQIHPIRIDQTSKAVTFDNNTFNVLRYIRLKMRVYKNK